MHPSLEYADHWCAEFRSAAPILIADLRLNHSAIARRAAMPRPMLIECLHGETDIRLRTFLRICYGMGLRMADLAARIEPLRARGWAR